MDIVNIAIALQDQRIRVSGCGVQALISAFWYLQNTVFGEQAE